jgi:hypothetical protein
VRQAQIAEERAMSVQERMLLALELGELCEEVKLLWAADREKS